MAGRVILGVGNPALDSDGRVMEGALFYFYENGTTTLGDIYADADLSGPLENPLVADSAGRLPDIWAADAAAFTVLWKTAEGATVRTFEDIRPAGTASVPTSTTVTAGTGLSGGGALSGNITLNMDINELNTSTDLAPNADYLLLYDVSAGAHRKVLLRHIRPVEALTYLIGDETTDITTGAGKLAVRMPAGMVLTGVRASLATASSSGVVTVDINENGSSILSTKLTIDANEKTSVTAANAAVISDANLADDAEITFDIDDAGAGAKGLKVTLIGYRS